MHEDAYFQAHQALVEQAVTTATASLYAAKPSDPLRFLSEALLQQASGSAKASTDAPERTAAPPPSAGEGGGFALLSDDAGGSDKWTLMSWTKGTGVHRVVATALQPSPVEGLDDDEAALAFLRSITDRSAVESRLATPEAIGAMADLVWASIAELQKAGAATSDELQSKFAGSIQLSYSGLSTFFGGLEGIVGAPNPKVDEGMEAEHVRGVDADAAFVTGNYGINTTSRTEWLFVADEAATPEQLGLAAWPAESEAKLRDRSHCRVRRPIADIESAAQARNEQLKLHDHTPLGRAELIAANTYTGPARATT